jgi:hypothetical protein
MKGNKRRRSKKKYLGVYQRKKRSEREAQRVEDLDRVKES